MTSNVELESKIARIMLILIVGGLLACSNPRIDSNASVSGELKNKEHITEKQIADFSQIKNNNLDKKPIKIQESVNPKKNLPEETEISNAIVSPSSGPAKHLAINFDVSAVDVPAQQFFMSLVEGTKVNILVHPSVTGTISIRLKSVTMEQALKAVRDVYGYDYIKKPYGYQIIPLKLQSRIFRVNYLNVNRSGNSSTLVSSGQVSFASGAESSDTESSGSSEESTSTIQSSQVKTITESNFWSTLEDILGKIIGSGKEGSVVVDPQAGLIYVRAYPDAMASVEDFLRQAEEGLHRQVIIEAKILEVSLSDGFESGIQWDTFGVGYNGQLASSSKKISAFQESASLLSLVDNSVEGIVGIGVNLADFTSVIQLLESHGDVKVLSSPRIATVNNQKAVIKVGTDEFFVTNITNSTTTSAAGSTANPEVSLTPFFSGIALDVTPHVGADGEVILHVHPTITTVEEKIKNIGVGEGELVLPLAFSSIRESDSIIRAKDGQIVVIGGLMQDRSTRLNSGVPGLSKIPGLGRLFKQERNVKVRSELVILLRPRVVGAIEALKDYPLLEQRFPDYMKQYYDNAQ